jgi:hypothetical protein
VWTDAGAGYSRESIAKAAVFLYLMAPSSFGVAQLTQSWAAITFRLRFQGSERHTRDKQPRPPVREFRALALSPSQMSIEDRDVRQPQ